MISVEMHGNNIQMNNQEKFFVFKLFTKTDFSDASLLNFKKEKDNARKNNPE